MAWTGHSYIEHKMEDNSKYRQFDKALRVDGANDYWILPNNITHKGVATNMYNLLNVDNDFSISYWQNNITTPITNTGTNAIYFLSHRGGDFFIAHPGTGIGYAKGGLVAKIPTSNTTYTLNKWCHIVGVKQGTDPNNWKIYVNGIDLDSISTFTILNQFSGNITTVPAADGTVFGSSIQSPASTMNAFFEAYMAEMIIFDRVITSEEIRRLYNRGTNDKSFYTTNYGTDLLNNRILHYSFHQDDYTNDTPVVGQATILDLSGNGNNATIIGQTAPQQRPNLVNFY